MPKRKQKPVRIEIFQRDHSGRWTWTLIVDSNTVAWHEKDWATKKSALANAQNFFERVMDAGFEIYDG